MRYTPCASRSMAPDAAKPESTFLDTSTSEACAVVNMPHRSAAIAPSREIVPPAIQHLYPKSGTFAVAVRLVSGGASDAPLTVEK